MSFKLLDLLFCFNSLRAYTIEKLLIILSSIGILLCILGIIFIPWKVTNSTMEILFILGFILIIFSLIIAIIIFYLRIRHKLRKRIINILIIANMIILFICFIALILFVILAFFTISDLNNKEITTIEEFIEQTGEQKKITIIENDATTKAKKILSILIIIIVIVIIIILILLWISEYIRLILSTDLSYKEYIKRKKDRALRHPTKSGLNVLGHDKYGFPIFGKQRGQSFIIKGVKSKFKEKIQEKPFSRNIFDENGKINIKYYAKYSEKPIETIKEDENIIEKQKYMEKYFDGENLYPNYNNFENNTILNFEDNNNSINPGSIY